MEKLWKWITNLFTKAYDLIEEKAPLAVRITQMIKTAIEEHDGKIEWLLDQTKTTKDNEVYYFIKDKLGLVIREIAIVDGLVSDNMSAESATKVYFEYIASKAKEGRAKEYIFLAARILQSILGKKVPYDLLILATQKAYHILFGSKK